MTPAQLYQLADEHGRFAAGWVFNLAGLEALVRDAVLAEREECAKLCEMIAFNACNPTASECVVAIRARGQA